MGWSEDFSKHDRSFEFLGAVLLEVSYCLQSFDGRCCGKHVCGTGHRARDGRDDDTRIKGDWSNV